MLLSQTAATPLLTSFSNPRQITAKTNTSALVIYTVPTGKKFQGVIYSDAVSQFIGITPAGGSLLTFQINTSANAPFSQTLVAGTVVTTQNANTTFLIGVETDA